MLFVTKKDKRGLILKVEEKIFLKVLMGGGWSVPQVRDLLIDHFDFDVSMNTLYHVRRDFRLADYEEKYSEDVVRAKELKKEIEDIYKYAVLDELERTRRMRLAVDNRLVEHVESDDMVAVRDLNSLSKNLFEREQLLAGKPTSITGTYKEMSDADLIKELKKLNAIEGERTGSPKTNRLGAEKKGKGGEAKVLETPSKTGEIRKESPKDTSSVGGE